MTQKQAALDEFPMGYLTFGNMSGVTGTSYVNVNGIRRTLKRFPGIYWVFKATATAAEAGDIGMTQLIDDYISHNGTACYRSAGYVWTYRCSEGRAMTATHLRWRILRPASPQCGSA